MSKRKAAQMNDFTIVSLDYKLEPGYEGNLSVNQKIRFALPTAKEMTTLDGEFEVNISGDGDKEFHFNVVGRGTFELEPDQMEQAMELEPSVMDPMVDEMGKKLSRLVAEITALFGIPAIELEFHNQAE